MRRLVFLGGSPRPCFGGDFGEGRFQDGGRSFLGRILFVGSYLVPGTTYRYALVITSGGGGLRLSSGSMCGGGGEWGAVRIASSGGE